MTATQASRRKGAAKILESSVAPLEKVRRLVGLGYDEADAETLVQRRQSANQLVYYEQLPNPDYDD